MGVVTVEILIQASAVTVEQGATGLCVLIASAAAATALAGKGGTRRAAAGT